MQAPGDRQPALIMHQAPFPMGNVRDRIMSGHSVSPHWPFCAISGHWQLFDFLVGG